MSRQERITTILTEALQPSHLAVLDESHLHAGHAGARPEGETHYRVEITAAAFQGQTRLQIHRQINKLLTDEFSSGLHALAIVAQAA